MIPSQHDGHGAGYLHGLPCRHATGIGTVEPSSLIEQHHLLGLALGVEVGNYFEGRIALNKGHLHVETSEVDSQNCLALGDGWEDAQEEQQEEAPGELDGGYHPHG